MKIHKILSLTALLPLLALPSCEKNSDRPEPLEEQTYSGREQIEVIFNGTEMAGKSAHFTPGNNAPASLDLYSEFDLSQLGDEFKSLPALKSPGVLPGAPDLKLAVELKPSGDAFAFSGTGDTDFVTYSYLGNISSGNLKIEFRDVTLHNLTFAGSEWKPAEQKGLFTDDTQPFHIVWETSLPIPIPALESEVQDLLRILVNVPFIPAYGNTADMSLTQVISKGLSSLAFGSDGNLPVHYLQTANGASTIALAPKCMFQYIPLSDSSIKLYVNPTDLLSLILLNNTDRNPDIPENPWGKASRADMPLQLLLANLLSMTVPMIADGFPMAAVRSGNDMQLYFPSELLLPLLKNGILPILQSEETRALIAAYVAGNEQLASYAEAIKIMLDMLPVIINQTTRMEFGLNLTKY